MKLPRRLLNLVPSIAFASLLAPSAQANTITGVAYCNTSVADGNSTPAPGAVHSGTQCATFTASSINFTAGSNTLGSFLTSGNLIGNVNYLNGYNSASNLDLSLFLFTGTAYFVQGQTYSATHDDGTVMSVGNSIVINSPGQTSPITSSFVFSGATGNYTFQYDYTEAYGGSTYTSNATASPVPEPQSLVLMSTGCVLLFGFVRLRSASNSPHTAADPLAAIGC